tara:strand:- start:881 stop:1018 length:138 start_codon:yes stop_codon:yes gene_type:complete
MILSLIMGTINAIVDLILAFIPKKLLFIIIVALIAAIYFGYTYNF